MNMKTRFATACLLAVMPAMAWGNIIPTGTSITGTGPYVWTYNLQLARDGNVNSGLPPTPALVPHENIGFAGFVTIYDFAGYIDGSCTGPSGWVCTAQDVGFTPDDVLPTDNRAITNLTWAYLSGPTLTGQPAGLDLGMFSASSMYGDATLVHYVSRTIKNQGPAIGTIADNVGSTHAPVDVPEPSVLALSGLALALAGTLARRRRAA